MSKLEFRGFKMELPTLSMLLLRLEGGRLPRLFASPPLEEGLAPGARELPWLGGLTHPLSKLEFRGFKMELPTLS